MKRVLVGGVVLTAVAAAVWYSLGSTPSRQVRLPGTVEVQEVRLGSRLGGRVATVLVTEGQLVEPGQVLLTFDSREWDARKEQASQRLAAARAALDKANLGPLDEEVSEAQAAAEAAAARLQRVSAGYREEERRQAKAELEIARAELVRAEADWDRLSGIASAVSRSERDTATASLAAARGRVDSATAAHDRASRGNRTEDVDEARAELDRLSARHAFVRRGTRVEDKAAAYAAVNEAAAALDGAIADLTECVVRAPSRCVVQTLPVRVGSLVSAGQPVLVVHRADDLWVKAYVPATELGRVRVGQGVSVAVDSHPDKRFAGRVSHVAVVSEFTPRNVQSQDERRHQMFAVKVRIEDPDGVFKSGMAAEVFLDVTEDN